jgi:hypothetical protein
MMIAFHYLQQLVVGDSKTVGQTVKEACWVPTDVTLTFLTLAPKKLQPIGEKE